MGSNQNTEDDVNQHGKRSSGPLDHLAMSESLGYHIFRKKQRRSWHPDEDATLKQSVIEQFLDKSNLDKYDNQEICHDMIDWERVAKLLPGRKSKDCRKRWSGSVCPTLRKGKWTPEEDAMLRKAYQKHGMQWGAVAMDIPGRNEDQCSKRYTEVLQTDTRDRLKPWSLSEDLALIAGVRANGTKWRLIATTIPGRPSLTCRNRWRRLMNDVAKGTASAEIMEAVGVIDQNGNKLVSFDSEGHVKKTDKGLQREMEQQMKKQHNQQQQQQQQVQPQSHSEQQSRSESELRALDGTPGATSYTASPVSSTDSAINLTAMHKATPPTKSYTEWKYSLTDPRTGQEMSQFSGPVDSHQLAHQLIELAKFNGVNLTIHQHIHHHYSPASPVLDPQASVTRFSHFNYLPPLTEVPKLTSSSPGNSPPKSSLMRLLNDEKPPSRHRQQIYDGPNGAEEPRWKQKAQHDPASSIQQQQQQQQQQQHQQQQQQQQKPHQQSIQQKMTPVPAPQRMTDGSLASEDIEEEMDFWDTLRSIAQPKIQSSRPVSQHHPLHYVQAAESGAYTPSDLLEGATAGLMAANGGYSPATESAVNNATGTAGTADTAMHASAPTGARSQPANIGGTPVDFYQNDEEDEAAFYNVIPERGNASANRGYNEPAGLGYMMPFNPS